MRLIDADALKKSIDDCDICNICPDKDVRCDYDCDFPDFLSPKFEALIDAQPTIEPKRGEWIWDEQILSLVCSECKELGVERSNFCPNCGCRMKGADDE